MARVAALTVLGVVAVAWPDLVGALGLMLSGAAVVGRKP